MYIFLVFVTIICFSMVLKSMKKPENLFVCLEYDINRNVKINSQPFALNVLGSSGMQLVWNDFSFSPAVYSWNNTISMCHYKRF